MFENVTETYTGTTATFEIIIMLLVSFILGYLLRYFLEGDGAEAGSTSAVAEVPLSTDPNDLKVVEGIGPKIEELLKANSINNWSELARADEAKLKSILEKGGDKFRIANPASWAHQAGLARDGKWSDLKKYQEFLIGGRE